MWKVHLAYFGHRFLLFLTIFAAINFSLVEKKRSQVKILSFEEISTTFSHRISELEEVKGIQRNRSLSFIHTLSTNRSVYYWVARIFSYLSSLSPVTIALLTSNLFFLLYLKELYELFYRMESSGTAASAVNWMVLWPSSFEMSCGDSFSAAGFLSAFALRNTLDNRWWAAGLAMGVLALSEPFAFGMLPWVFFMFWFFQQHFQRLVVIRNLLFLVVPLVVAAWLGWGGFPPFGEIIGASAFKNLFHSVESGASLKWTFSHSSLGQTITVFFLALGAVLSVLTNSGLIHRAIAPMMLILTLLFSRYQSLSSRIILAGVTTQGIAAYTAGPLNKLLNFLMVGLSLYEAYLVFS